MVIATRTPIFLMVFILILATFPGTLGYISVSEGSGDITLDTGQMVLDIEGGEISFYSPGSTQRFYLRYSELLGYKSDSGFGPPWVVYSSLEDLVWNVKVNRNFSEACGNYTELVLSSDVDGTLIDTGSGSAGNGDIPSVPGPGVPSPPSRTIVGWCSLKITVSICEGNRTFSDDHETFVVLGMTEAKIDVEIEVKKDAGVDRIALKQELNSPGTEEYLVENPFGSRNIVPEYGRSSAEEFSRDGYYINTMSFRMGGKEWAHYSWNSYATIGNSTVPIETYYAQENGSLAIYTVYPALAGDRIFHDPVIGVPHISGPAETVVNSMYEHGISLAVGIAVGVGAISTIAISKFRKERKKDDILDFENSEYLRK